MFVGVDTGGTFTDFFVVDEVDGEVRLRSHKVLSTPDAPEQVFVIFIRDNVLIIVLLILSKNWSFLESLFLQMEQTEAAS